VCVEPSKPRWARHRTPSLRSRTFHTQVGLLLDAAIEPELRLRHLQAAWLGFTLPPTSTLALTSSSPQRPHLGCKAADACRATLGINVAAHVVTDAPLGVEIAMSPAGASWGTLRDPEALLRAARRLQQAGCTAIAVAA
jgi:hypothetical protein